MKKMTFVLVIVVLLAACQSAPQPPAETETLADSYNALVGIWYARDTGLFLDITRTGIPDANLALSVYNVEPDPWQKIGSGTLQFESGKLTFLTGKGSCEKEWSATYEIYLVSQNGSVIGMRPKVVGEDACADRKMSLDSRLLKKVAP